MPGREDVTDLLNGVGDAAALISPDPNASAVTSPTGPSNLREEMTTPQTNFSPNFSIATEEANELEHQDMALRDRRLQALERNRRLKRAAKERSARRDRKRIEDEQVDLGVRMRLLNMGLGEDEAAYLMRDYEAKWTRDDIQLRVKRFPMMDDDTEESSEDDQDTQEDEDDTMAEFHGLDDLLDGSTGEDQDVFGSGIARDGADMLTGRNGTSDDGLTGDETLQTPRRKVRKSYLGYTERAGLTHSLTNTATEKDRRIIFHRGRRSADQCPLGCCHLKLCTTVLSCRQTDSTS